MFDDLNTFKAQNGYFKDLGRWVNVQKVSHKKNALNSNYIQQLISIGFIWDPLGHAWNEHFNQLCAFKAKNGHCNVSRNDVRNKSLGQWVSTQRVSCKKNTLRSDRIQQLNSIDFVWDLCDLSWNEHFDQLCAFKAKNGHCIVSQNDAQNTSLVEWVRQQRVSYKKNTLSSNRIQQLNSIGFIWDLHERSYELWWMRMYQERIKNEKHSRANINT